MAKRKYLRQIAKARLAKMGVKTDKKSGFAGVWRSVVGDGEWAQDARNAQLGTGKARQFRLMGG